MFHKVDIFGRRVAIPLAVALLTTSACESDPQFLEPVEATGFSEAYDKWAPGPNDTCTGEIHNSHSVVGPDGLVYPTWHPSVDPATACKFGHEHGRDPRGSDLYAEIGDPPFGLALPADHVGYKIDWENDVDFRFDGAAASSLFEVSCDVLAGLHQGSHGAGAFTINLHEFILHARCSDRTEVHITMITAIGEPGEFRASCDGDRTIIAGPPPPNSPSGGGERLIPDRQCVEEFLLVPEGGRSNFGSGLRESWQISDRIRTKDGHTLVSFNPYFQVLFPSRYYDPDAPNRLARSLELCFESTVTGEQASGSACDESTNEGQRVSLAWDDPRSGFRGARRFIDINTINISNDGPEIWYTDKFGKYARRNPFPGSIRQFISRSDENRVLNPSGPAIGRDRDYGKGGVHAPN